MRTAPVDRQGRKRLARDRALVTAEDVLKTCRVAAALALQGEAYGEHDRADTTAALVLLVMERAANDVETCQAPRANGAPESLYPARLIGMDFLVQRAANERRRILTERGHVISERESNESWSPAEDDAPKSRLTVHGASAAPDADPLNDGTPWGARITALNLLADAGLWEGARSGKLAPNVHRNVDRVEYPQGHLFDERREVPTTVRAQAPSGPLWTLAYTAARATGAGMEGPAIADELGLTVDAHKAQCSRAARLLRKRAGIDARDWFPALNAEGMDWSAPEGTARTDERTRTDVIADAPRTGRIAKRTTDRGSEWSAPRKVARTATGRPVVGGKDHAVDPLTPLQRRKYETATARRRAKTAGVELAARNTARRMAGLPEIG